MNDPLIGTVLDSRYKLLERIGEGGMGVVYKAQHIEGPVVAIKVLNPHLAQDPNWVQRFYNEAKATSQLQHPNTIRMHEFGQSPNGVLYLSMEFLDGLSLSQVISQGPMEPARVLNILAQCCASLAEAHERSIIHRDMKPDNVFVLGSPHRDQVKVLDFSVAKLLADRGFRTAAGMVFGTPEYMSPEQGRGRDLDARSDIYAVGCIAYEMLTGKVPFTHPHNPMAVLQAHMTAPPPPLPNTVPQPVEQIVTRALDKEPGRRFSSATEMKHTCETVLAQLTGQAPPAQPAPPPQPAAQQHQQQAPKPAAAQKTMMASAGEMGVGGGGPPPAQKAAAKTVFAMESPVSAGGPPPPAGGPPPPAGGPPPPAGGPPPAAGGPPPAAGGPPPAAGGQASAAQKTMFAPQGGAGGPPPTSGPPPMTGGPPGAGKPGQDKTMMASDAAELLASAGAPPTMDSSGVGAGPPPGPPHAAGQPGGGKTVMLSPSDGVVSFSMGANAAAAPRPGTGTAGGASLAFWLICLSLGVALGAGAYFLMIMLKQ